MSESTQRFAGRVVNDSRSTNAPGVRMSSIRFIRNHSTARFLGQICLIILFLCIPAGFVGMFLIDKSGSRPLEIVGGILLVIGNLSLLLLIPVGLLLAFICRKMAVIFREALLTPGIVVSESPLEFAALTNMSTGGGPDRLAVQRFRLERLPGYPTKLGTRFPCVSFFQGGSRGNVWADFSTEPLCFATGKQAILDARMAAIGAEDFDRLAATITAGSVPDKLKEVRFL